MRCASDVLTQRDREVQPENHLKALAERVARLTISRRDPEAFFVERSEIAAELRRLARRAGR